jgi:hypothetical protein
MHSQDATPQATDSPFVRGVYLVVGIGGGGDALAALPTICHLHLTGSKVVLANVHFSTAPDRLLQASTQTFGRVGVCLPNINLHDGRARPTEVLVGAALGVPTITFVVNHGAAALAESIRSVVSRFGVTSICAVDGGTDSLAGMDTRVTTVVTDAIALRALDDLASELPCALGVIGACADDEMSPACFLERISKAARARALLGILPFPPDLVPRYRDLLAAVQDRYPCYVSEAVLRSAMGELGFFVNCYARPTQLNPLQALTFLLRLTHVTRRINHFVPAVRPLAPYDEVVADMVELLRVRKGNNRPWAEQIRD